MPLEPSRHGAFLFDSLGHLSRPFGTTAATSPREERRCRWDVCAGRLVGSQQPLRPDSSFFLEQQHAPRSASTHATVWSPRVPSTASPRRRGPTPSVSSSISAGVTASDSSTIRAGACSFATPTRPSRVPWCSHRPSCAPAWWPSSSPSRSSTSRCGTSASGGSSEAPGATSRPSTPSRKTGRRSPSATRPSATPSQPPASR